MRSFRTVDGDNIHFERIDELVVDISDDIVSGEATAWFIEYDNHKYEVSRETYEAIKKIKGL